MANTIQIRRITTPRYGSRNWAKQLRGEWTAQHMTYNDCTKAWEIKNAGKLIAVIEDCMIGTRPNGNAQAYMVEYGSDPNIGNALYGDLCEALEALIEDIDDDEKITFIKA